MRSRHHFDLACAATVAVLSPAALACAGSQPPPSKAARSAGQPPHAVRNVYAARIAGDDHRLWLVVGGRPSPRRAELELEVFSLAKGADWQPEPALPGRVIEGVPVSLVVHRGRPCVAASRDRWMEVRCLRGRTWRPVYRRRAKPGDHYIQDLVDAGSRMVALTSRRRDKGRRSYGGLVLGQGSTRSTRTVTLRGLAALGAPVNGRATLVVQSFERSGVVRRTYQLTTNGWMRDRGELRGHRAGPEVAGPVWQGERRVQAVNEGSGERWPFSVAVGARGRWQLVERGPLNRTAGRAQGVVTSARGRPWAIWQEHVLREDGSFDAQYFAGVVNSESLKLEDTTRLWAGRSIGPGDMDVTAAHGHVWALTMRPPANSLESLQPYVQVLR
jgi:hypothetical protein